MTDDRTKQWYIVHTYSGFEKKVLVLPHHPVTLPPASLTLSIMATAFPANGGIRIQDSGLGVTALTPERDDVIP